MQQRIKKILKKVPFSSQIYAKLRAWHTDAQARRIFANSEVFLNALTTKGAGLIDLETRDGLTIKIRQNVWDARIVKEVFMDKPYTRYVELPPNPTIVDIGGYIGDFSIYAAKYLNARRVIVYEPTAENFEILVRNVKSNAYEDRITAVKKAVGDSADILLNVNINDSSEIHVSSYFYPEAEHRVVPSASLSEILSVHELESVDLLKVDCEGGEYDIFPNVLDETYDRIRNIVFEYHKVDGFEEKLTLVIDRLRSAGFSLKFREPIVYAFRT